MTTPIVVPQRPMGLGDVFGLTFSILRSRFRRLAGIALVSQLVTAVLAVPLIVYLVLVLLPKMVFTSPVLATDYVSSSVVGSGLGAAMGVVATVLSLYFLGLLVHASNQAMMNRNPSLAELRALNRGTMRRLGPVYLVAILAYYLALGLGVTPMLTVFPDLMSSAATSGEMTDDMALTFFGAWGVGMLTVLVVSVVSGIVLVKAAYINQVGAVEGLGGVAAVRRALALTKGSFWRTAGYLIVMGIAVGMVEQAVGIVAEVVVLALNPGVLSSGPQAMLSGGFFATFYGVVYTLVLLVQVVCVPFQTAFVTAMYVDQVQRIRYGPVRPPMPGQPGWQAPAPHPQQPTVRPQEQPPYGQG